MLKAFNLDHRLLECWAAGPDCLRIDSYLRPEAFLGDLGVDESLMSDEFWHTLREAFRVDL